MQPQLSHLSISFIVSSHGNSCGAGRTDLQRFRNTATHAAADHCNQALWPFFFFFSIHLISRLKKMLKNCEQHSWHKCMRWLKASFFQRKSCSVFLPSWGILFSLHAVWHLPLPGVSMPSQTATSYQSSAPSPQSLSSWATLAHNPAHVRCRDLRAGTEERGDVLERWSCGSAMVQ